MRTGNRTIMKALILSPHPSRHGGVADYVGMLKANLPTNIAVTDFYIGARPLAKPFNALAILLPVYDAVRLFFHLIFNRYDVIHINPSFNKAIVRDSLFMLVLRLFGPSRVLVFIHGWNDAWARRVLSHSIWRGLFWGIWGGAGQVLLLASRFKTALVEAGLAADRIEVVSTMFDGRQFDGVTPATDRPGLSLLFLSRFVREKGCYETLEGFARIKDAFPQARLVCAGDGPELAGMRAWVAARGLDGRVAFPGFVRGSDKARLLLETDVFVFPTYYGEGCPVSLLEAMAAGCAIVTGDAGGIPDIFTDGKNGVLLTRPTAESVADGVRRLLADDRERKAVGDRNRQIAWARFEAKQAAGQIAQVYARLAAMGNRK